MDLLITGDSSILSAITKAARRLGCQVVVIGNQDSEQRSENMKAVEQIARDFKKVENYKSKSENDFIEKKMKWKKERWQR